MESAARDSSIGIGSMAKFSSRAGTHLQPFLLIFVFMASLAVNAQDQASVYFDDPTLTPFIHYAVHSGRMQLPFILSQPYTALEVRQAVVRSVQQDLPAWQRHWLRLLIKEIGSYHRSDSKDENGGYGYLGGQGTFRALAADEEQRTEVRAELEGKFTSQWFALAHKTVFDQRFKYDPAYFGDTGEWIYGRPETGYVLARYKGVSGFLGRISRNWGIPGEKSLILSDHPYSYDAAGLQLASQRFRFSFYAGRLDDMYAINTQSADSTYKDYNRFWSIKRFDIALSSNLQLGFSEAALYGDVHGTWEMIYLNPLNLYYVEQRNNVVQMNGLWCADVFYKPSPHWTLYAQYLIDDIIINNEPGKDDRGEHPDRMGITVKTVMTDVAAPATQIGLSYTRIGNWTYMSYRNYENYISNGLSMGYPCNSIERIGMDFAYFGWIGWSVQMAAAYSRKGEQDITAPFGDSRDKFPRGHVTHVSRFQAGLTYVPSIYWHAGVTASYDYYPAAGEGFFQAGLVLHVKYGELFRL